MSWAGHAAYMGNMHTKAEAEGNRPLRRPRRRWEDSKMDVGEIGLEDMDWMHLVQGRDQWQVLLNMVMNPQVP
jgi:hypothetical protein